MKNKILFLLIIIIRFQIFTTPTIIAKTDRNVSSSSLKQASIAQVIQDFQVNENAGKCSKDNPSVTVDSDGNYILVWEDTRNGEHDIYCQRYDSNGKIQGSNFIVNDNNISGIRSTPAVAAGNNDGFAITWVDDRNGDTDIYLQRFDASGSPLGSNVKVNDEVQECSQMDPAIGIDGSGNIIITWTDMRNGAWNPDIFFQIFDKNGSTLGSNTQVNDDPGGDNTQRKPAIAVNLTGTFVIAWEDKRQTMLRNYDIYCQRYNTNGTPNGNNFQVNDDTGMNHQYNPAVSIDSFGNFVLVWEDYRDGNYNIYCQRYNTSGSALEDNFMVNPSIVPLPVYGDSQTNPELAMDDDGNFIVTWTDNTKDFNGNIYCKKYNNSGSSIGTYFTVNDDTDGFSQNNSSIAVRDNGEFIIIWKDNRNGNDDILTQRYNSSGTEIDNNFRVTDDEGSSDQVIPSIAVDGKGNMIITWQDERNGHSDIYAQCYDNNCNPLKSDFKVNGDTTASNQEYPSVASCYSGYYVIVWMDYRNDNWDIYFQLYDKNNNNIGDNIKVNDDSEDKHQRYPGVNMDSNGNFIVVWQDARNGQYDIYYQKFNNRGTPSGSNVQVNEPGLGSNHLYPAITEDETGNFVIVWEDDRAGVADIYCQRYDYNNILMGTCSQVNDYSGGSYNYYSDISMNQNGDFIIVWEDGRNGNYDIYSQRYDGKIDSFSGSNSKVNSGENGNNQINPAVSMGESGNFIITWQDNRNSHEDIYAQHFTREGKPARDNFKINNDFGGIKYQGRPDVALSHGLIHTVWEDSRSSGQGIDIFASVLPCMENDPFTKVTSDTMVHDGGFSTGSCWGDYNNDGFLDLFVSNDNEKNFLYLNNTEGNFTRIAYGKVYSEMEDSWNGTWGDYDDDGDLDLFITNKDQNNSLHSNDGDGTLTKILTGEIVNDGGNSFCSSWCDYDNNGQLDLYVVNWDEANFLYHNNGSGTFEKITEGHIVTDVSSSLGCSWADYNNDRFIDLLVTNSGQNYLYKNNQDGTFTKIDSGPIATDGGNSFSSSWCDYDNDGDLDLFVSNGAGQNNFLYRNDGESSFTKITEGDIVNDGGNSISSCWGDYDNDGDPDLFVANVQDEDNFLYSNNDNGTFTKITESIAVTEKSASYGSSWADYDNDGDLDLFVANWLENNFLYKNNGNSNNWINIKCIGDKNSPIGTNVSAIGTRVHVKATIGGKPVWQMQEISAQTGRSSQNSLNVEFGLGDATIIDSIKIVWSCCLEQIKTNINVNQILTIQEPVEPAIPQDLTAKSGDQEVLLTWSSNYEGDMAYYIIYRSLQQDFTPTSLDSIIKIDHPNTSFRDIGLINGVTYYYRIVAVDTYKNKSDYSKEVAATPVKMTQFTKITTGAMVNDMERSVGTSWADYDNDNDLDLFVPNIDTSNFCYTNNGDGTFTQMLAGKIVNIEFNSLSSTWGDYDNDGDLDLFIANTDENDNALFSNNGDGTFTQISSGEIVNDGGYSMGCSWGDYDNDGYLDLFVANGQGTKNFLYHNNGNSTFTKITEGNIVNDYGTSWGCSWADYDNDGDLDLFVANINTENDFLYENNGNGTFTKITTGPLVNDGAYTLGGSWGDFDNDGDLDLFVAANDYEDNYLYVNNGNKSFTAATVGQIEFETGGSTSSSWGDFDNDGNLDLFVTYNSDTGPAENLLYINNGDATFTRDTTSIIANDTGTSLAATWTDFNNDGDLDLFVSNMKENNFLYSNQGNTNHWINIKCIGDSSNTSAIGVKVKIKSIINGNPIWQMNEISAQTGTGSQNSLNAEFGTGNAVIIDTIRVEWPSGIIQILTNIQTDQFLTIIEKLNHYPVVTNMIPDTSITSSIDTLIKDLEKDLMIFTDPDGDSLIYSAKSSDINIAAASIIGSTLTVIPEDTGSTTIIVEADDTKGGVTSTTFTVTVLPRPNRSPVLENLIPDTTLTFGLDTLRRDLEEPPIVFSDPDGDSLTYSANSSELDIANTLIDSSMLVVTPVDSGTVTITVIANDGKGDSVSTSFSVTIIKRPIEPPQIIHTPPSTPEVAQGITITADISDDTGIASAMLNFRKGGDSTFTSTTMTQGSSYQATIPDTMVTSQGIEYFILTTDSDKLTTREPLTGIHSIQVSIPSPGIVKSTPQPEGDEQTAYRLISVPMDVVDKKPSAVLNDDLGGYDKSKWRFFELTSDQYYVEYSDTALMKPGKAFWLIVKNKGKIIDTGGGISNLTSEIFKTALHPGWNFVANPFNFSVPMSHILLENNLSPELRYYNGAWNNPDSIEIKTIEPFEGYALFNDSTVNDTLSINPCIYPVSQQSAKQFTAIGYNKILWAVNISAQCQNAKDPHNAVITAIGALKGKDKLDRPEPPSIGEFVSLYFHHPEWKTITHSYCTDARPEPQKGDVWTLGIRSNISDEVKLTFKGIEEVPDRYEIWLIDEAVNISYNLRTDNCVSIASSGPEHPRQMKLFIGIPEFKEDYLQNIQDLPNTYELAQNFPNPFNPVTTIRYGLPKNEKVTLKIYNILGKEVVTLVNGEEKEAGNHAVIWKGKDDKGIPAAGGIYFIRMHVGDVVKTRKMILLE
jgi:hypothetical protein